MTHPNLSGIAQKAAEMLYPNSVVRREAFAEGATLVQGLIAEQGMEATIGTVVREQLAALNAAREKAERVLGDCAWKQEEPGDQLDERGKRTVILVAYLLRHFTEVPKDDLTGRRRLDPTCYPVIVRAVSYITWAYLAGTFPMPTEEVAG